jgi:hypothetical protein
MVAVVLSLVIAFLVGGATWLLLGSRLKLADEDETNQLLNLVAYVGIALAPAFLGVFFLLDRN